MKIATYNVENLFDMNDNGTEYEQYIPNTSWGWNEEMHRIKLRNTAKVIRDIGADVIGLQEVESEVALKELKAELNRQGLYYPYYAFARSKNTTVAVALLSRYPITSALSRSVGAHRAYRDILEVKLDIKGKNLRVFVNHWKSKSGPESMRVQSAKVLKKRLEELDADEPFLLIGDFNSHYEEYRTFVRSRKHNDTEGITGINHILKTIDDDQHPISYTVLKSGKRHLYNLWYELPEEKRWSHQYRGANEGLDNIIISPSLADGKGLEYVQGSFGRFEAPYLFYKGTMYRWQQSRRYPKHHLGEGYSDHLPIYAVVELNP
ncbi:MAG: endonuclease/exonuclease/phosphatase family protein [Sulfuricurvum sp.]|nr:endonuclease/exonuclease/phosphatase family protein [Sulfuricurvum sp.]